MFQKFSDLLVELPMNDPQNVNVAPQKEDGKLMSVLKMKGTDYKPLYCWYNCKAHVRKHGGRVIFGWALFYESDVYQAQHHAIWCSPEGEYLDPTPDSLSSVSEIKFLPDSRVPFNYETRRRPFNYYSLDAEVGVWGLSENGPFEQVMSFASSPIDEEVLRLLGE